MIRPVYAICSKLTSEDRNTGLLSLYHVIEELAAQRPSAAQPVMPFIFKITSVWMRDEDDSADQDYDFQIRWRMPAIDVDRVIFTGSFRFVTRYQRFVSSDVLLQSLIPEEKLAQLDGRMIILVDSAIRPVGSETWSVQSYPITVAWAAPVPLDIPT